jgi:hypothetical protein
MQAIAQIAIERAKAAVAWMTFAGGAYPLSALSIPININGTLIDIRIIFISPPSRNARFHQSDTQPLFDSEYGQAAERRRI